MAKGILLLSMLILCGVTSSWAQNQQSTLDSTKVISSSYLLVSENFQNRINFMGRNFGFTTPLLVSDLLYWHPSGAYVNASISKFFIQGVSAQKSIGAGWMLPLGRNADLDLSYSYYTGGSNLNLLQQMDMGIFQGSLGLDWDILYSSTQVIFLRNQPNDFFLVSRHSRYFEVDQRIGKKAVFSFEPSFTLFLGTNRYYRLGGYDLSFREFLETDKFTFQGLEWSLPISISWEMLDIQLEPRWITPLQVPDFDSSRSGFQFSLKTTYFFSLKKKK